MNEQNVAAAAQASLEGTQSFPEIVAALIQAGVEYYHVDYATRRKTFYGVDGGRISAAINYEDLPPIAADFSVDQLKAAIMDSQRNGQKYRAFSQRAMSAGVQGYFAFLRGKRVTYLGRQGDQHTEWFPGSGPGQP